MSSPDGLGVFLMSFFSNLPRREQLAISDPLSANVRPLPTPPVGFTGLVGTFRLQMTPSARQVKAKAKRSTLNFGSRGTGSLQGYTLPEFEQRGFSKLQ